MLNTKQLVCCCCGRYTRGRQWWNRDTGYGLCNECITMNGVADVRMGATAMGFGIRGYHWDLQAVPVEPTVPSDNVQVELVRLGTPLRGFYVQLHGDTGPLIEDAESRAIVAMDWYEQRLQLLSYSGGDDEPVVAVRLGSKGKVVEISIDRKHQDKVMFNDQHSAWLTERDNQEKDETHGTGT